MAKIQIEDADTVALWCPPNSTVFRRETLSTWLMEPHGSITVNGTGSGSASPGDVGARRGEVLAQTVISP